MTSFLAPFLRERSDEGGHALASLAACLAIVLGVAVVMGWAFDLDSLKSVIPGAVQMKINTAVGLVAAGAALWLGSRPPRPGQQQVLRALAVAVGLLGIVTLAEYAFGTDVGIDQLLAQDRAQAFNTVPGRMSPLTAWSFLLLGGCLAYQDRRGWARAVVIACASQVILIGAVALLGHLWNAGELVTETWWPPVAVHTAVALLALGTGVLAQRKVTRPGPRTSALERKLMVAFWVMVVILTAAATFSYRSNLQYVHAAWFVAHTQQVRVELAGLDKCVQRVEWAQHRYLLAGDDASRQRFRNEVDACSAAPASLVKLVTDNREQSARALRLQAQVPRSLQVLQAETLALTLDGQGAGHANRAALMAATAPQLLDPVRQAISEMDAVEQHLLRSREQAESAERTRMLMSLLLTLLVSVAIIALLVRAMRQHVRKAGRLHDEMAEQKLMLASVINSIPDIVIYKDLQGRNLGCNQAYAAMAGRTPQELVGRTVGEIFPPEVASQWSRRDGDVMAGSSLVVSEDWITYPDGRRVLMELVRGPMIGSEGRMTGLIVIGRDITARQQVQQELRHARELADEGARVKSDFLANMSHEIRTPLTGVMGLVEILASEPLSPAQCGYVEGIRTSGRHLLSVINDILDFSKIESGNLQLEDIDFSLAHVLDQLRALTEHLAVERGINLKMELAPHAPPAVRGDPTRLLQVLLNLVGNAIKFTERGSVHVCVTHSASQGTAASYRFEVRDTGVGIATDALSGLFAPFKQTDSSTVRRFGGTGLGLAITKRLVEAMGGSVGAASTPGQGSTFHLEIPLETGDPARLVRLGRAADAAVQPRRILVAEDVAINREILKVALGRQGHDLAFAIDGQEAVRLARQQVFDLVLMDVQMPVMDGVEATRLIRQIDGPMRKVPIIGLTANVMAHERDRYLAAGMDGCLTKPIDWSALRQAIAGCGAGRDRQVDTRVLAGLRMLIGEEELGTLVRNGMATYQSLCDAMVAPGCSAQERARLAHKIKGSAGTMGFVAIGRCAADIEEASQAGEDADVQDLQRAVVDARAELEELGYFPERVAQAA